MLDLMMNLQDELGLSYVFISHDIGVIRYMCDRVAVMYRGRVVETGSAEQVCDAPTHAYTQALALGDSAAGPEGPQHPPPAPLHRRITIARGGTMEDDHEDRPPAGLHVARQGPAPR